jgi:hypothetical protein
MNSRAGKQKRAQPKSKTSTWERLQDAKYRAAEKDEDAFDNYNEKMSKFRAKILEIDPRAEIIDLKQVRHFKCGKTHQMKYPWNPQNFKTHATSCTGPPKSAKFNGGGMQTMKTYFTAKPKRQRLPSLFQARLPVLVYTGTRTLLLGSTLTVLVLLVVGVPQLLTLHSNSTPRSTRSSQSLANNKSNLPNDRNGSGSMTQIMVLCSQHRV